MMKSAWAGVQSEPRGCGACSGGQEVCVVGGAGLQGPSQELVRIPPGIFSL